MKQTINEYQFTQAFTDMNRDNNFSYEGKKALYEWLEEYEESTGEEMELDVIAICCDFTEYESLKDFQGEHDDSYKTIEDIEESTIVIPIEGKESFIVQSF